MRTLIALVSMVLSGSSLADSVRHLQVPERFWGTWARSPDLCRDKKSIIVVSDKGYVTPEASCEIQWLTETAGRQWADLLGPYALHQPDRAG
jgi:hypothetical protein